MKLLNYSLFAVLLIWLGCEPITENTPKLIDKSTAKVQRIGGLYVFIKSEPETPYKVIDNVIGKDVFERAADVGVGKEKPGKVLKNIIKSATEELSFSKKVSLMAAEAARKHRDAHAIVFRNNLSNCEVIKFKE